MSGQKRLEELQQQLQKSGVRILIPGDPVRTESPAQETPTQESSSLASPVVASPAVASPAVASRLDATSSDPSLTGRSLADQSQSDRLSGRSLTAQTLSGQSAGHGSVGASPAMIDKWDDARVGSNVISTGCPALDAWFPRGGIVRGQTIELIGSTAGAGATCVALMLARQICGSQGLLVLIDRHQDFHASILLTLGFDLEHVLIVHPSTDEDHLWALEQALSDPCVAAVWTRIDKIDKRYQRRWQLAAERGQTVGLLQRPEKVLGHPTWATLQLEVRPNPHSHWLTGNRRVVDMAVGKAMSRDGAGSLSNENHDDWIVQLVARRGVGRFEATAIQLELHNRSWQERSNELGAWSSPAAGAWFFSQRLPHPNDPWFTKPDLVEAEADSAASGASNSDRATNEGSYSMRRRRS